MVKFELMKQIMMKALTKGYDVQLLTIQNKDQQRQNHLVDGYMRIFVHDSRCDPHYVVLACRMAVVNIAPVSIANEVPQFSDVAQNLAAKDASRGNSRFDIQTTRRHVGNETNSA
jgi:hypothetical protein